MSLKQYVKRMIILQSIYARINKLLWIYLFAGSMIALLYGCTASSNLNYQKRASSVDSERTIQFSGYTWVVRDNPELAGPGPNIFNSSKRSVWVDRRGRLHLMIRLQRGKWTCAEIVSQKTFGYGTFRFTLAPNVFNIDPQAVLGLFLYDKNASNTAYREIDIEVSKWGFPDGKNIQYALHSRNSGPTVNRFKIKPSKKSSVHEFKWSHGELNFHSYHAADANSSDISQNLQDWTYDKSGDVPKPGNSKAYINLWLYEGKPAYYGKDVEVVIENFEYLQ